jgi:uncharacterized protein
MNTSSAVAWFEIPVADMARAIRFYNEVLGVSLKTNPWGEGEIAVFPYTQGAGVGGSLMKQPGLGPSRQGAVVYLPTEDLAVPLDRVKKAGGEVVVPKTPVGPGLGYFARFADSEGNVTGLFSQQ